MRTLRNLYHSIHLAKRIPTDPVPTLSNWRFMSYPDLCTLVPRAGTFKLLATEFYRHADTSKPILFDFPRWADSNDALPDSGGHLPTEVFPFFSLLTSIAMRTLRDVYHSIPLGGRMPIRAFPTRADICPLRYLPFSPCWHLSPCGLFETYTIQFPSVSGFQWDPSRLWRTSAHWGVSLFLPADLYSHADSLRPIPFDSPRRADSNKTLPDSGRHLPAEVSPLFSLLTSIAMRTLRNLHHSIPLDQ